MSANDKQVGGEHYRAPIQHWDLVVANNIPYLEAQILRYVMRHKSKNGLEDLRKAQHFLEKLIEVTYPSHTPLSMEQQKMIHREQEAWLMRQQPSREYVNPDL